MKILTMIALALSAGLSLGRADANGSGRQGPYAGIAARNVFSLTAREEVNTPVPAGPPPPKILVNGTTSLFGREQVLFKVIILRNSPGQHSDEFFYVLAENEEQDGVKVLHIEDNGTSVRFNNHGVVQDVPLANLSAATLANKPPATPSRVLFRLSNQAE